MVEPNSAKNAATASLPRRIPYHGAAVPAAAEAQSTSSVTASRMAATSPRPKASYTLMMVLVLASALMLKSPPRQRMALSARLRHRQPDRITQDHPKPAPAALPDVGLRDRFHSQHG